MDCSRLGCPKPVETICTECPGNTFYCPYHARDHIDQSNHFPTKLDPKIKTNLKTLKITSKISELTNQITSITNSIIKQIKSTSSEAIKNLKQLSKKITSIDQLPEIQINELNLNKIKELISQIFNIKESSIPKNPSNEDKPSTKPVETFLDYHKTPEFRSIPQIPLKSAHSHNLSHNIVSLNSL